MIKEITNFVDYLEDKSPEIFSENLELKEGIYIFLEKEGDKLVVKEENVLRVGTDTERNKLYEDFLLLATNTEMMNAMKSFNSGPKIFIAIGSPYGIAINAKSVKNNPDRKILLASEAYFKAARRYINNENEKQEKWCKELEAFVNTKMFDFFAIREDDKIVKDQFMFYFFLQEPELKDYQEIQSKFLSEKLFNKDKFNVKSETGEIYGVADSLSGFNDSKEFLKHKTSPIEINYRINGIDTKKLYMFFRLQQRNKILPNPFPLFVDEQELSEKAIKFYKKDQKAGHKEIIEELIENKNADLSNYYLIYFHNGQKGSRIVDLDFVPVFRYNVNDVELQEPFNIGGKLKNLKISNIFEFQQHIFNKIFNEQLIVPTKAGSLWVRYFDNMEPKPEYGYATETIVGLFYSYRKSIYDYVYKSKRHAISDKMFQDMMKKSILDDISHDKEFDKTYRIKEKLNIWFSLYNYFEQSLNKTDMINKTEELFKRIKTIAKNENERIKTDEEFAFASGQIIWKLLIQSESANKTHALLEPFLQKTDASLFKQAIARTYEMYKHKFDLYPIKYKFDKIMSEVMGVETDTNLKTLMPLILAGYFSETIFKKDEEN